MKSTKSKELEALERVKPFKFVNKQEELDYQTIEKALKDYYRLKNTRCVLVYGRESGKTFMIKLVTALEILRDKKVNIKELLKCDNVGKYNYRIYKDEEKLTQNNFELLKEILS